VDRGDEFERSVREVAASEPGTYDPDGVPPAVLEAARTVRNQTDSEGSLRSPAAATSAATGSTSVTAFVKTTELVGPNGATIPASQAQVSQAAVSVPSSGTETVTVEVRIPDGVSTGEYDGSIRVFVSGTVLRSDFTINVTKADDGTYRARIQNLVPQWDASGPQGKAYYEQRMADQLTNIYFNESTGDARTDLRPVSQETLTASTRESHAPAAVARAEVAA
jgi:hypothetical protein